MCLEKNYQLAARNFNVCVSTGVAMRLLGKNTHRLGSSMREKRECQQGPKNEDEIASVCPSHTKPVKKGTTQ